MRTGADRRHSLNVIGSGGGLAVPPAEYEWLVSAVAVGFGAQIARL